MERSVECQDGQALRGYEILERLQAGGFGVVYRARQQSAFGREVAIKAIKPELANYPDFIRRFESEAEIISRLEHPHIVPLYDYWRDAGGAYLVMRYLHGGSIKDALLDHIYDLPTAARILEQVASALAFAHRHNVVHRDIKPSNILLDEEEQVYVAEFGIAKDLQKQDGSLTEPDAIVGSPDYITPEQARGESISNRTDIYSLGVTLYEMLTGRHPFAESPPTERLVRHMNEALPMIDTLPEQQRFDINDIIQKATAKQPEDRYSDVIEFATAFREVVTPPTPMAAPQPERELSLVEQLTWRKQEILALIMDGMTNAQIAQYLNIEVVTVKSHITQLYKKLGVKTRVQASVCGRSLDLLVHQSEDDADSAISTELLDEPFNPYKGLYAFQTADADVFFGREKLVTQLIDRMQSSEPNNRFLAVVGPSGSGKSSLVKAGLIPALRNDAMSGSQDWFIIDMMPGSHPLDTLETALIRIAKQTPVDLHEQLTRDERGLLRVADILLPDDGELLLVVDQFEEVFTQVADEARRRHFLDLLYTAATDPRSRMRVLVTLRADYYDRPFSTLSIW